MTPQAFLGRTLHAHAPGCATHSGRAAQPPSRLGPSGRLRCGPEARPKPPISRLSTLRCSRTTAARTSLYLPSSGSSRPCTRPPRRRAARAPTPGSHTGSSPVHPSAPRRHLRRASSSACTPHLEHLLSAQSRLLARSPRTTARLLRPPPSTGAHRRRAPTEARTACRKRCPGGSPQRAIAPSSLSDP